MQVWLRKRKKSVSSKPDLGKKFLVSLRGRVVALLALITLCFSTSVGVLANSDSLSSVYLQDESAFQLYSQLASKVANDTGVSFMTVDSSQKVAFWNEELYEGSLDLYEKEEVVSGLLSEIKNSNLQPKSKNLLYTFIEGQDSATVSVVRGFETDLEPDLAGGYLWWEPFSSPFTFITGIVAWGIFLFLAVSYVVDSLYLVNPMVRNMLKDSKFVSLEARSSISEMERDGQWTNYLLHYFKRRVATVMVFSICLSYMISGLLWDGLTFLIDVIGGLF